MLTACSAVPVKDVVNGPHREHTAVMLDRRFCQLASRFHEQVQPSNHVHLLFHVRVCASCADAAPFTFESRRWQYMTAYCVPGWTAQRGHTSNALACPGHNFGGRQYVKLYCPAPSTSTTSCIHIWNPQILLCTHRWTTATCHVVHGGGLGTPEGTMWNQHTTLAVNITPSPPPVTEPQQQSSSPTSSTRAWNCKL